MFVKDPMTIRIVWLSPEQPPDGHTPLTPEQDNDRRDDIQQKQLSMIRHYRALIAEKDEEIGTLKADLDQRHALIEQEREKIVKLKDELSVTQTLYAKSRKESEDAASRANAPIPNDAIFMELWGKVSAAERGLNQALYFLSRRIDELAGIN